MTFQTLFAFIGAALSSSVGFFVLWTAPRSFVHRVFAGGIGTLGLMSFCVGMSAQTPPSVSGRLWEWCHWLVAAFVPGSWLLFSLSFARANYREHLDRWRWCLFGLFAALPALVICFPQSLVVCIQRHEVRAVRSLSLGWAGYAFCAISLCAAIAILVQLEKTLRASAGRIRAQIKFVILGLGSFFAVQIYTTSQALQLGHILPVQSALHTAALLGADILIGVALVRRRLLNIELYLSRTVLYNTITIIVVGIYLIAVARLVKIDNYTGGNHSSSSRVIFIFLALLVFVIALISDRLRQNTKHFINRHFYRSSYDYRKAWTACTQRMASVVKVEELCSVVCKIVSDTFGVPSVTVWLLDGESQNRLILGGSTVYWGVRGVPPGWQEAAHAVVAIMLQRDTPIDFAPSIEMGLASNHRMVLQAVQIRYGVGLWAGQQLLGVLTLSERLTQEPFSIEDFELLKTMAHQSASSLLNLQLSQELLHAKEMAAFQTVSAFCVHDLKNLSAKLSLMVQNLPKYYDDPAFRDDMLQVISKSVSHMNEMCSHLNLLTHTVELHLAESDLNALIIAALEELEEACQIVFHRELQPLPRLQMDSKQLQKVLTNLLWNAMEAVAEEGEIVVATAQMNPWAVLIVRDDGCGMSQEFVQQSLFAPFQTTKSQGLGIGMFHSKKIVEAHRGRIEVESTEGKGSTFRVYLPLTLQVSNCASLESVANTRLNAEMSV